jgi:2-dehydropantoate 2-reductase
MIEASVLVVGAGAIGGVTAAEMTGEVRRVAVLDANEEHVERMRGDGLLVDDLGEERRVPLDAHADPGGLDGPFDFALVTLKAPHLKSPSRRCLSAVWRIPSSLWATASCRSA